MCYAGLRRFLKIDSVKAKLSNVGLNETLKVLRLVALLVQKSTDTVSAQ